MSKRRKKPRHANSGLSDKEQISKITADITAERQAASTQLSTQSRTVALGVLAVAWLLLGGTQQALVTKFSVFSENLLWIAALCIASLVADFLQYASTLHETNLALDDCDIATKPSEAGYDDPSWWRRLTNVCFGVKLGASLGAAGWLLGVIYNGLQ